VTCQHDVPARLDGPARAARQRREAEAGGGSQICKHRRQRSQCVDCGGGSICEHGKRRSRCKHSNCQKSRAAGQTGRKPKRKAGALDAASTAVADGLSIAACVCRSTPLPPIFSQYGRIPIYKGDTATLYIALLQRRAPPS